MLRNILVFAVFTLPSLPYAWIFPRNSTQYSNHSLTIVQSDLVLSTTASKIQKLQETNTAFKFYGTDLKFTNDAYQVPVESPFTIHNHSIDFNTDGYYRIAFSDPADWQELGTIASFETGRSPNQASWSISEAKTSPIDALTRLQAAGCMGALSGMQLIKTKEVDGKSRIWYKVYGYLNAPQDNENTTTAWISDDASLSYAILVYRERMGTQAPAYLTCDGKVVNTHSHTKM